MFSQISNRKTNKQKPFILFKFLLFFRRLSFSIYSEKVLYGTSGNLRGKWTRNRPSCFVKHTVVMESNGMDEYNITSETISCWDFFSFFTRDSAYIWKRIHWFECDICRNWVHLNQLLVDFRRCDEQFLTKSIRF